MARKIGQITQSDCYINEVDVCGRVTELDMGEIAHAEIEHQTLGMIGVLKLPGRPVQAIDGKITFEWLDEEVSRNILNPTKVHKLQLHSYVDIFDGEGLNTGQSHTLITHIGFQMMKTGGRTAKLGENLGQEHDISISSFKQSVYGGETPIIEFDAWNNIYRINGANVWPR
ncbi:phage major tail tube protein [Agrobacterium genomosp. 3 str. CIP 111-78]|uniref:Phage tail protein n=1 Tax=Agrobacterium tumefaciens TaxID=358 RepID=A0AAE6EJY7_AGRTU|nr:MULTISPECIES: phage major tail tube protein [Agrobacterium tumefaciens complex]MCA2374531.1 phage major tail tube protein [Agrobacterium tomkonis CIP 111-78]QCL99959.1 phage tail protein [Agrobacterium tumefaciens]